MNANLYDVVDFNEYETQVVKGLVISKMLDEYRIVKIPFGLYTIHYPKKTKEDNIVKVWGNVKTLKDVLPVVGNSIYETIESIKCYKENPESKKWIDSVYTDAEKNINPLCEYLDMFPSHLHVEIPKTLCLGYMGDVSTVKDFRKCPVCQHKDICYRMTRCRLILVTGRGRID